MTLKKTRIYNSDEIEKINGVIVQNAATEIASSISTHAPLTGHQRNNVAENIGAF